MLCLRKRKKMMINKKAERKTYRVEAEYGNCESVSGICEQQRRSVRFSGHHGRVYKNRYKQIYLQQQQLRKMQAQMPYTQRGNDDVLCCFHNKNMLNTARGRSRLINSITTTITYRIYIVINHQLIVSALSTIVRVLILPLLLLLPDNRRPYRPPMNCVSFIASSMKLLFDERFTE